MNTATQKIALVTGGGSGIGQAIARQLAAQDIRVVIVGRRESVLLETAAGYANIDPQAADILNAADLDRVLAYIEKTYGKPVAHWFAVLDTVKALKHMEQVAFLKHEHKLGHGHANALVAYLKANNG